MAAIGDGWVDGAWVEAGWVTGANPAWFTATGGLTVTLSGTITTADEQHIRSGGRTIILTLDGDTWVSGAAFDAARQDIIDGLDSAGSESTGWNTEVRDKLAVTTVVRTSDTVVTITLSAQSAYDITAPETITVQVPGTTALTSGEEDDIFATPSFTISLFEISCTLSGTIVGADETDIRAGGKTIILTLTGDDTFDSEPNWSFGSARQQIIDNLLSAGSELTGWNNEVRDNEVVSAVSRTSDTVVTITLTAAAAYDISANETITSTIPAIALDRSTLPCGVTPTFTVLTTNVTAKRGGIGGKYYKKRRVMIDGRVYRVHTLSEERALLDQYLAQQQQQLDTAEPAHETKIRACIRRAERRREKVVGREAIEQEQVYAELLAEDDEILALMMLH